MTIRRPRFNPTAARRRQVAAAVLSGHLAPAIARRYGVDTRTLRRHFAAELEPELTREQCRLVWVLQRYMAAIRGSYRAQRDYLARRV
jgi:FixJ family two-component response regulator